jgi:predicted methyltransferase
VVILSRYQAKPLLDTRAGVESPTVSLDLGVSEVEVLLEDEGIRLPGGSLLPWAVAEEIAESDGGCFVIEGGEARKVQVFSEETGRTYGLWATHGAPTMLVSGIPMHRIKGTDPIADTRAKIRAASPVRGRVLDTCTGLGYTAIEAAKTAGEVVTIELDPAALEVARMNPWSRGLFEDPKIRRLTGDAFDVIDSLEEASFDVVIHDPPMFSLAGDLYSLEFYQKLKRVTRPRARLFHYIGDPESKMSGNVTRGVVRRLEEAGFKSIRRRPEAFGVSCVS